MNKAVLSQVHPIVARDMPSIIVERMKALIAEGTFAPGMQLTEVAMATAFGVSRGPIREAIQRLTQEGLLRSERNRGTFVPNLSPEDVEDVYLVRAAVELAAMDLLIQRSPQTTLDELDDILDQMQSAVDACEYDKADELDHRFHQRLVDLSGSPRLAHAFERVSVESRMCLNLLKSAHPKHPDITEWHRRYLRAIRAGSSAAAKKAVHAHNATVLRDLLEEANSQSR